MLIICNYRFRDDFVFSSVAIIGLENKKTAYRAVDEESSKNDESQKGRTGSSNHLINKKERKKKIVKMAGNGKRAEQ